MKITNTTSGDLGLGPEVVVPAGGTMDVDPKELAAFKASPVVSAWFKDGSLVMPAKAKA